MKFYIHTFGCQMNENDSERIAGMLTQTGAQKTSCPEKSDLFIINTCAVRQKSEEKLFSLLGRLKRIKKSRNALIGVVGCVAQLHQSRIFKNNPPIDFVLGPGNYTDLPQIIRSHMGEKFISTDWKREWQEIPHEFTQRENKASAFVTIMEGCNNFCSYCVVPFTRGREVCRPLQNIIREIEELASRGYKEIQLLGQNVNSYQDPESGKNFPSLLKEVDAVDGIAWIRFITSHPKNFTPETALAMQQGEKICHQLHLPLQSGSSSVLKRMNRGYSREEYLEKISLLRKLMPDISLSTDIIVGFPSETEDEFQETLQVLEEVGYAQIYSFRFSPRPLTAASRLEDNVPFEVKKRRLIQAQEFQKRLQLKKNKTCIGKVIKVLCTGKSKKDSRVYSGRNEGYQVVNFEAGEDMSGEFVNVLITACGPHNLRGEAVNHKQIKAQNSNPKI